MPDMSRFLFALRKAELRWRGMSGFVCFFCVLSVAADTFSERISGFAERVPNCLSRFLDYPPGPGVLGFPRCLFENPFPPNPDFWLKGIDFSCASPWNDSFGCQRAGTAISKRHIVFAAHHPMFPGTRIAFVGEAGDVSHYSLKATKALGTCDIMIGLLDYELTPDVHPAKILPVGFEKTLTVGSRGPIVTFNKYEQAYLSEFSCVTNRQADGVSLCNVQSQTEIWRKFGGSIVSGDSGNPAFLLYNGSPILVYCLHFGGLGSGPMIHEHRTEVQRAMDELCPGYKLEVFDFAAVR